MEKMYLQIDNGGYGLLITDGEGNWYYWDEALLPISLDAYDEDDGRLDDEANAKLIRKAIASGEMYDAEDFITESEYLAEHMIPEYNSMSIEDIDYKENYMKDLTSGDVHPLGHDETKWIEI